MGFYFRKSIRVGPLRFNLSKSGIGVSTGIPGFRVGTGPRGNYVHMGVGGLYYRSTLPSTSPSPSQQQVRQSFEQPPSHAPLEHIGSADVSQMIDSSSAALLSELDQKNKRMRTSPLATGLAVIVACILVALQASPWIIASVGILSLIGVLCAYQFDLLSKTVVILYDLDSAMEGAYERVHDCILQLARCGGKWHIDARGHVYDPKYHGGAGQLVSRKRISIGTGQPPYVKTNIAIPFIPLGARTLFFFPERILVFARNGVGAVSYDDLSIVINDKRFIEDEAVPRDAQVIDQTWQYVNKSGAPDRRFNNNHQIPICLYQELWLNSPTGLNEVIQISRTGIGEQVDAALQGLADIVAKAAAMPVPAPQTVQSSSMPRSVRGDSTSVVTREQGGQQSPTAEKHGPNYLFDVLLEVLCCLMVADGRASSSEKNRIRELMAKVRSPWTDSEVDDHMAAFINRVQRDGYRRTLAAALKDVDIFKRVGKQDVLLRCLDAVAGADEKLGDRELQLCQHVKAIVE